MGTNQKKHTKRFYLNANKKKYKIPRIKSFLQLFSRCFRQLLLFSLDNSNWLNRRFTTSIVEFLITFIYIIVCRFSSFFIYFLFFWNTFPFFSRALRLTLFIYITKNKREKYKFLLIEDRTFGWKIIMSSITERE